MSEEPLTEKEDSALQEKEQDTMKASESKRSSVRSAKSAKSARTDSSKTGKKLSSAKSNSTIASGRKSPKSRASTANTSKKSPSPEKTMFKVPPPPPPDVLPEGCKPLFLASQSQTIFHCKVDEDITEEQPFFLISKEDIAKDFFNRAAVSDFTPFKKIISEYPGVEILIMYDPDYKHGQNFVIATTEESKNQLLTPVGGTVSESDMGEGGSHHGSGDGSDTEEEDTTVYQYVPPVSKPWITQGSEVEVIEESLVQQRKRLNMNVRRVRKDFGMAVKFTDRNVADTKDGIIDCASYEDATFEVHKLELHKGTQAIADSVERASQTDWRYPRNACTQYQAREYTIEEQQERIKDKKLETFVASSLPRFELAMQQNEIMNVFYDDWRALADDDSSFGSKADNHLKEYQSFTDLQFSKEKSITCIEWHPTIKGIVAVSVAETLTFDERIDQAQRLIMSPSLILVWSFADPIHPQLLLEAPDDIYSFKFSPTDPNIIAGGCVNGQVVLWDISPYVDRLKTQRGSNKRKSMNSLPGFEDENAMDSRVVRYCAVSSIEHSHRAPITELQWLPDHIEVNRMGVPQENKSGQCCQIITAATDHSILFWDTRPPKVQQSQAIDKKKKTNIANPTGVPSTFKHLDLTWKPLLKVNLPKSEPGGDHSPVKFSIHETQGDRNVLNSAVDDKKRTSNSSTSFGFNKAGSAKRTLASVNTHFYVGTEDGEIVYADWMPQKDQDSGKIQTPKPDWYHCLHDGPIDSLHHSPFFKDIILCVGGWTMTIWKEGVSSGPLLSSSARSIRLTGAFWSSSRPAVFYVTKQDGSVDVWDLLDKTHEASMTQNVSPSPITCIYPFQVTAKQHLLAVGDASGTLHILEIPWSLRQPTPNEYTGVSNYFERETNRRTFVQNRWNFREAEKMKAEADSKKEAGIAPHVKLSPEEEEIRLTAEYAAYVEEENQFLRTLGLKDDDKEELLAMD